MARKKSPTLTEAELRLMEVVWKSRSVTVGDVVDALKGENAPAYNTVLTTLRILEQKEYLRHEKEGRAYVYHPLVEREDARRGVVKYMMSRFFNDSPEMLLLNILENEEIDPVQMAKLRALIDGDQ